MPWYRLWIFIWIGLLCGSLRAATSQWAHLAPDGTLVYRTSPGGDRIMDFSYAGYGGGGVAIPIVSAKRSVRPTGDHDTFVIQQAIDAVSKMPLVHGFRGAVLLAPGTYVCHHTLTIHSSGVVLRGAGIGKTIIRMAGAKHLCIRVTGGRSPMITGHPIALTRYYVPCGTLSLTLQNVHGLSVGDHILIGHPITRRYIHFMGMDKLFRNGRQEHWISGTVNTLRRIIAIRGTRIELNAPLTDSINPHFTDPPGATVVRCETSNQLAHVGLENFEILSPPQHGTLFGSRHNGGIQLNGVSNAWLNNIAIGNTVGAISVGPYADKITMNRLEISHATATAGAALPADFSISGSRILINRCTDHGSRLFYFVTGARASGPNVLLNCNFYGNGSIQPHQRWATGLLVDNCHVPQGSIEFINRGEMGSGHGWTIGWAVAWNCQAHFLVIQNPPGAANWAIGCTGLLRTLPMPFTHGPKIPTGIVDHPAAPVDPPSLYLAQLRQRLGNNAIHNIGY